MPTDADHSAEFLESEPPHWVARGLAYLLIGLFVVALTGAFVIRVPETVGGRFRLVPRNGTDPVRAFRGGVVTDLVAREGDTVRAGGPILVINSSPLTDRSSDHRTLVTQRRGDEERLRIAQSQYATGRRSDEAEIRRLRTKAAFLEQLVVSKVKRLALSQELADSARAGLRGGAVNRVEAARMELDAATLAEEVQATRNELDDVQADIARIVQDGRARDLEYAATRRGLEESMETAKIRIGALERDLTHLTDSGLEVVAPCAGLVLRLYVSAPGAVVQEGEVLSEVACAGDRLQAEFLVPQAGVPQVKSGQTVKFRFDAFPYQRYGVRYGTVRWIGSAGFASRDSGAFRALVDLQDTAISIRGLPQSLMPGMEGLAHVVVGRRSLVSLAFEPLRALRETFEAGPP